MMRLWQRVVRLWRRLPLVVKVPVLVAGLMVAVAVTTSQVVLGPLTRRLTAVNAPL
jgi:hypothetical protein